MKRKKINNIIRYVLFVIIIAMALYLIIGSIFFKNKNQQFYIFNCFTFNIVATGSMEPTIPTHSFVIVKKCSIEEVKAEEKDGDIVMYVSQSANTEGKKILHRAVFEGKDEQGNIYLKTCGDAEGCEVDQDYSGGDKQPNITSSNFCGICVFHSYVLGNIVVFLQSPINWIFILIILICGYIIIRAIKGISSSKSKEDSSKDSK